MSSFFLGFLRDHSILKHLTPGQLHRLANHTRREVLEDGALLCVQGEDAGEVYLPYTGQFKIIGLTESTAHPGAFLGENGLGQEGVRQRRASIVSVGQSSALVIPFSAFTPEMITTIQPFLLELRRHYLATAGLLVTPEDLRFCIGLEDLTPEELQRVADHAIRQEFQAGETILTEGDPAEDIYVILEGQALFKPEGIEESVAIRGEIFGEVRLEEDLVPVRRCDVVARTNVVVARIEFGCLTPRIKEVLNEYFDLIKGTY